MGGGTYSFESRISRATTEGYYTKSRHEVFSQRKIDDLMNPYGVKIRESRDSEEHPKSYAAIIALDVTGSMGFIPHYIVKEGIVNIMSKIMNKGLNDIQILFMGIGDHKFDIAPLQVGQFESSDELLDRWLTSLFLEGGGGGNFGEDYLLAWYFANYHTSIDCFEKRKNRGTLITIGDEPPIKTVSHYSLNKILGGQCSNLEANSLFEEVSNTYTVRHLHMIEGSHGKNQEVITIWRELIGNKLILIENMNELSDKIADIIISNNSKIDMEYKSIEEDKSQEILL